MASARGKRPQATRFLGAALASAILLPLVLLCPATALAADCAEPLAELVLVKGSVELIRQGSMRLVAADRNAALCAGDSVVVHQRSQAALLLSNATVVRLDQGTTVTLSPALADRPAMLNVSSGAAYVITRTPRPFRVRTPFINANVEGTEFLVEVRRGREPAGAAGCPPEPERSVAQAESDRVTVFEGRVQAVNDAGSVAVTLMPGESAIATASSGPVKTVLVRPRDAVTWTLYVPPLLGAPGASPPAVACAEQLLAAGQLDDARRVLESTLPGDPARAGPGDSASYALLATIAVAASENDKAERYAGLATSLDPNSASAWIARSYAQQALFQVEAALASALRADALAPNAARKARVAELQLSVGDVDAALASAAAASQADPALARTQAVAGFVSLARAETGSAKDAFEKAIALDPADPLPRLGLGLARIRAGDLAAGRQEIEIAAVLDTESSLIRSCLGKAYYEEKRDRLAESQFALAKEFDAKDPTPWFYGAILRQSDNRPVEALRDLQTSIALNGNRAVYRSRLLLDQDQAARMVNLANTYRMLGFDQLALLEAVKSLSLDPGEASAHRFLADSYAGQVRSEGARVGELFQSQLRQPLGLNTISPELLTDRRQLFESRGPAQASAQEFAPLFDRNQLSVRFDGLAGNRQTVGDQVFVSGLHDALAYSAGQYHYETDGLRANNDFKRDVYDAFLHFALSPGLRIQAELRDDRLQQGDLSLRFDPEDFSPTLRDEFQRRSARVGAFLMLDPASSLVLSAVSARSKERLFSSLDTSNFFEDRERLSAGEVQYLLKRPSYHLTAGLSSYLNRVDLEDPSGTTSSDERGRSVYALATLTALPWGLRPQLGFSYDTFDQAGTRVSRLDPKLGLLWQWTADTVLRAAWFKTIKRNFDANQTLQPTQVFGFNQVFDEPNGTLSRRAGVALQHTASATTFVGAEGSARDTKVPGFPGEPYSRWTERFARGYFYRILGPRAALAVELQYEHLRRPEDNTGNEAFTRVKTLMAPVSLRLHWPQAWSAGLQATYANQKVQFVDLAGDLVDGRSSMVVLDASVAYRLPRRIGSVSLEARNLFDRRFRYQEIDAFSQPRLSPRRTLLVRVSTAF